ncbi:MAG: hypothetical protein KIPDCIKN_02793 [Haliscomenobacter sp.]|nr:hypothetical protein [Haliscomenobacter sp.]
MRTQTFVFLFAALPVLAVAQVTNDDCSRALPLTNIVNWCSPPQSFTTAGATPSSVTRASCFPDEATIRDVWYSFVAQTTDVNVSVTGNTALSPGGTLGSPQLAIYSGACNNLTELECISDAFGTNTVQTFASQLQIGATYYIRVAARGGATGTFQLCINSFTQPPKASSDCPTANILCSKAPFTVEFVQGEGKDPDEVTGVCGRVGCQPTEEQSTWFRWTCQVTGTLTFTITPLNPTDDLDFVVFELPGGVNDCSGKRAVRCMSSGENVGQPISTWRSCTGATGLRDGERDNIEYCGCDAGDNNFISPLDMVAGRSYALVVNNFSRSGSGFTLQFGGTGTFVGPTANFTIDQAEACVGKLINLTDSSSFAGGISDWEWFFGPSATPTTRTGQGPHQVRYDLPGDKSIVLNVRTADGCIVSTVKTLKADCCSDHFNVGATLNPPLCPGATTGEINVSANSLYAPYQFNWASGQQDNNPRALGAGSFQVTITDQATCDTVLSYVLSEPPPIQVRPQIVMPTCGGGTDGAIEIQASGATPPYRYRFPGLPLGSSNRVANLGVGDYLVSLVDSNNCQFDTLVRVRELELILDPNVAAIAPPSCFGFSDGRIDVRITNGRPPYQYDWLDGRGFQPDNSLLAVPSGAYSVEVLDANRCRGAFTFAVEDFPPIGLEFSTTDVSCFGGSDGRIEAFGVGGAGEYRYFWQTGDSTSVRSNLPAGSYFIRVIDQNNCRTDTVAAVEEPPQLSVLDVQTTDLVCFGDRSGAITLLGTGGTPPYTYSLASSPFQPDNTFSNLPAGNYVVSVGDAQGCTAAVEVTLVQPDLLLVDAGTDRLINLGEQIPLQAIPSSLPVAFSWAPADQLSCNSCAAPIAQPLRNVIFSVTVTDPNGCTAQDEVAVFVVKNRPLFIPNSFSPNADGTNDFFTIYGGLSARSIRLLRIFDRWGELLFEGKDIPLGSEPLGWDGTFRGEPLPSGVYVYYAEVDFIDGEVLPVKGDVSLVR